MEKVIVALHRWNWVMFDRFPCFCSYREGSHSRLKRGGGHLPMWDDVRIMDLKHYWKLSEIKEATHTSLYYDNMHLLLHFCIRWMCGFRTVILWGGEYIILLVIVHNMAFQPIHSLAFFRSEIHTCENDDCRITSLKLGGVGRVLLFLFLWRREPLWTEKWGGAIAHASE